MATKMQFDVGMNNNEFMRSSRDIARAISSLKSTVAQAGKSMNSSATGYGNAMRESLRASREFESSVRDIKSQIEALRTSTSSIKAAADGFKNLKDQIESAKTELNSLTDKKYNLESTGHGPSEEWTKNQQNIAQTKESLEELNRVWQDYYEHIRYARERIDTGKDEQGNDLTKDRIAEYEDEIKGLVARSNEITKQYNDAQAALESYKQEEDNLIANGANPSDEWIEVQRQIDQATLSLTNMKTQLEEMRGKGYENADQSDTYLDQVRQLQNLESELDKARVKKEETLKPPYLQSWEKMVSLSKMISEGFGRIQNAASGALYAITHPVEALDRALGTLISKVGQAVSSLARMAGNGAVSFLKKLASHAQNAAIQLAKLAANAVSSGLKKIASGASAASKGLLGLIKNNKATDGSLKRSFTTILKYAFGVRSMYFLFRRLRSAVQEAFTEMAKSSPEVNSAINGLQAALNGLKGSLATAFAPIFTAIAPALTYLINMLTSAMNTIGAFFAALTGKSTFQKAIGGVKAAGASAGKSAKSAKKEVKELKRELAGFDELNILNDNNKDSTDSGAGGSGGAGSGISFKTEEISSKIKDFVAELKELWNNGEYEKIGKLVAKKINKLFQKAYNAVKWDNVKNKWTKAIDAFTGIFNGLITGIDWTLIGKTIGEGINTLLEGANYLLTHIDFGSAGTAFANALNGLFSRGDLFTKAGESLSNGIKGILNFGQMFLDHFKEGKVAEDIRNALRDGIDWDGIATATWGVIKTAFRKAGNFLNVLLGGQGMSEAQSPVDAVEQMWDRYDGSSTNVGDKLWADLADNFAKGINWFIESATGFIQELPVTDVTGGFVDWIARVRQGISFKGLGAFIGASFKLALDSIGTVVAKLREDAPQIGKDIADAINAAVKAAFSGEGDQSIAGTFTNFVIGAFDFIKAFLEGFDSKEAARQLKEEIERVDWYGIAKSAWEAFKMAVQSLGNFLTVLFGGDTDPTAAVGDAIRAGKSYQEAIEQAMQNTDMSFDLSAEGLAGSIGNAITAILTKLDEWLNNIPWEEWGQKIHTFLEELPWGEWGNKLASALSSLFDGLDDLIWSSIYGEDYKDNQLWQVLHPGENAKETVQGVKDNASISDEDFQKILDGFNMTAEGFQELRTRIDSGPTGGSSAAMAKYGEDVALYDKIVHAINLAGAPDLVKQMQENGANELEIITKLEELGLSTQEAATAIAGNEAIIENAIKEAQDVLNENGATAAIEAITEAVENNTQAQETSSQAADEAWDRFVESGRGASEIYDRDGELWDAGSNRAVVDKFDEAAREIAESEAALSAALEESTHKGIAAPGDQSPMEKLRGKAEAAKNAVKQEHANTGREVLDNSDRNIKVTKRDIKETKENTKWLKRLNDKKSEVDVNYEGAGFDTSGDKPKLNVPVDFVPGGEEDAEDKKNEGLLGWLQELLNADTLEAKIALIRDNWKNVLQWLTDNNFFGEKAKQLVALIRDGNWSGVIDWLEDNGWLGPVASQLVRLIKDGNWSGVVDWLEDNGWLGPAANQLVALVKQGNWSGVVDWLKKEGLFGENVDQLVDLVKAGNWTGVVDWFKKNKLFGPKLEQLVDLIKQGNWKGVIDWLKKNKYFGPAVEQLVTLVKEKGFKGVIEWLKDKGLFGDTLAQVVTIAKEKGFTGVIDWLKENGYAGEALNQLVKLMSDETFQEFMKSIGFDMDDPIIKTILNLLKGTFNTEAEEALNADGKKVDIEANLQQASTSKTPQTLWGSAVSFIGSLTAGKNQNPETVFNTKKVLQFMSSMKEPASKFRPAAVFGTSKALEFMGTLGNKDKSKYEATSVFNTAKDLVFKGILTMKNPSQNAPDVVFSTSKDLKFKGTLANADKSQFAPEVVFAVKTALNFLATLAIKAQSYTPDAVFKTGTDLNFKGKLAKASATADAPKTVFETSTPLKYQGTLEKKGENYAAKNVFKTDTDLPFKGKLSIASGSQPNKVFETSKALKYEGTLKLQSSEYRPKNVFHTSEPLNFKATLSPDWSSINYLRRAVEDAVRSVRVTFTARGNGNGSIDVGANKEGGIIRNGRVMGFASGGAIMSNGKASWWNSIQKYASGTSRAHGTLFVAGEAGPEIMGHVNGRTEILNKSQLADAMYGAVVSGMTQAVNALGKYVANHMTDCTNAIVKTIGANADLSQVRGLEYYAPATVTSGIMPYDVSMQIARSTQALQGTLDANNEDLIQAMVSAIGNAASSIIQAMQSQSMGGRNNRQYTTRQAINEINQIGQMFGTSPLKGV